MLSKIALASLVASAAAQGYGTTPAPPPPPPPPAYYNAPVTTTTTYGTTKPVVYYYADYDNIIYSAQDDLYYQSALTQEAVDRTKQGVTATWSNPTPLDTSGLQNAKGVAVCGKQGSYYDNNYGGKYQQVFVADAGATGQAGAVYGWQVAQNPSNPAAVVLQNKWTVYQPDASQSNYTSAPTDVKCGPNNGLFIADPGLNAIQWVSNANLVAGSPNPQYSTVIPSSCGAAVDQVRSLSWNANTNTLYWTNDDTGMAAAAPGGASNSGVFSYNAIQPNAAPPQAACVAANCDSWSASCGGSHVAQVVQGKAGSQYWAVSSAWNQVQVSKGNDNVYDANGNVVASVNSAVTYTDATNDAQRNQGLIVTDAASGQASIVTQSGNANQLCNQAAVPTVYGATYNNGYGWYASNVTAVTSASTVSLAAGAVLAAVALFF